MNPKWRNVQKTQWMNSKQPFKVHKADHKLISDRRPTLNADKNTPSNDPFTGIKYVPPSKKLDARLNVPDGEALSPNKKGRHS